jgi:hypothetical protein
MRALVRPGLGLLAVVEAVLGLWTLLFPASFYADVPTIELTPPFSEHLFRDFGGATLGLAVVLTAAAMTLLSSRPSSWSIAVMRSSDGPRRSSRRVVPGGSAEPHLGWLGARCDCSRRRAAGQVGGRSRCGGGAVAGWLRRVHLLRAVAGPGRAAVGC